MVNTKIFNPPLPEIMDCSVNRILNMLFPQSNPVQVKLQISYFAKMILRCNFAKKILKFRCCIQNLLLFLLSIFLCCCAFILQFQQYMNLLFTLLRWNLSWFCNLLFDHKWTRNFILLRWKYPRHQPEIQYIK